MNGQTGVERYLEGAFSHERTSSVVLGGWARARFRLRAATTWRSVVTKRKLDIVDREDPRETTWKNHFCSCKNTPLTRQNPCIGPSVAKGAAGGLLVPCRRLDLCKGSASDRLHYLRASGGDCPSGDLSRSVPTAQSVYRVSFTHGWPESPLLKDQPTYTGSRHAAVPRYSDLYHTN